MDADLIDRLLRLAALRLGGADRERLGEDLRRIVSLIDLLQTARTEGVAPLTHPLEGVQPLRPDEVSEEVDRDRYQRGAPAVRDGLYLVPRVLE